MIRKAFLMYVNPGQHAEYERRHRPVWQEMEEALKAHGVLNYSIYLDQLTNTLFGYAEIEVEAHGRCDALQPGQQPGVAGAEGSVPHREVIAPPGAAICDLRLAPGRFLPRLLFRCDPNDGKV